MKLPLSKRGRNSDSLRSFYFHLEALETSVIHPKYISNQFMTSLSLTGEDVSFGFKISEFVDCCAGERGAATSANRCAVVLEALQAFRRGVPSSQFDYRLCRYELDELEAVVTSMSMQVGRRANL